MDPTETEFVGILSGPACSQGVIGTLDPPPSSGTPVSALCEW